MNYEQDLENIKNHFTSTKRRYLWLTDSKEKMWSDYINITQTGYVVRKQGEIVTVRRYAFNHIQLFIL